MQFSDQFPFEELKQLVAIIRNGELLEQRNQAVKLACWVLGSVVEMIEPSDVGTLEISSPSETIVQQASTSSASPLLVAALLQLLQELYSE